MSPLNSILEGIRRRLHIKVSPVVAAGVSFLLMLTFICRATVAAVPADAHTIRDADVRRAEKILEKLRLLHDAASANDANAYRTLTSKLFPNLFIKVAELRPSNLSTDLSTAVFLAEKLGRTWNDAGASAADCQSERPDIYLPLCLSLRDGTVRPLLLAKSRLHARWAAASISHRCGKADAETARALSEVSAARANDLLIAALIVKELRRLEGLRQAPTSSHARVEDSDVPNAEFNETLGSANTLLTWLPRSPTFYQLQNAQQAYADGQWWHDKARRAKSLVVSAKSFVAEPLKDLRLDAEQVSATAQANWRSATKHTRLAEQYLSQPPR